jgi:excisionase family DNA binding protein
MFGNLNKDLIPPFTTDRLVTIQKAAALLDCHDRTIRYWIAQGKIPCYTVGKKFIRVRLSDLHNFLFRPSHLAPQFGKPRQYPGSGVKPRGPKKPKGAPISP